jgi:aspartate 1-decarboxylase
MPGEFATGGAESAFRRRIGLFCMEPADMRIELLKSKLHQACVTQSDLHYEGSLGIDIELMEAVGFYAYEKILVTNINNGVRLETYAIPEPFGSRRIILNGAAARHGCVGDRIIIMSFCWLEESEVREGKHKPRVLRLDERNEPIRPIPAAPTTEEIASMLEG